MPVVKILSVFAAIMIATIYPLSIIAFRPVKVIVDATGITGVTLFDRRCRIQFSEINKVRRSRFMLWKYTILTTGVKKEKLYIPIFLKNKTKFNELIREKIDNKKVLKALLK